MYVWKTGINLRLIPVYHTLLLIWIDVFMYEKIRRMKMEENEVNMLTLGCGDCAVCPYSVKCKEYSDYMKFVMGVHREECEDERA